MNPHTKNWQRVTIWIIAIAMAIGSLSFYFMIILQNNDAQSTDAGTTPASQSTPIEEEGAVDATAFTVADDVTELQKTDLKVGEGEEVKPGDTITAHYKGTFAKTGVKFDSSYDRGEPATFSLSGVIAGWQEGVPGMKIGGKRRLVVPSDMAYGPTGNSGIPPDSDLVFEIELLAVNPPTAPQ